MYIIRLLILTFLIASCADQSSDTSGLISAPASTPETPAEPESNAPAEIESVTVNNSVYGEGATIYFNVEFDKNIIVTGSPRIELNIGGNTRYAEYVIGSGSSVLQFSYTVASPDADNDGISMVSPIQLNGGTLKDSQNEMASLSYSVPNTSTLLVETTQPTISNITLPTDATYKTDDAIEFTIHFSETVFVNGTPRMQLTLGNSTVYADYVSGHNSSDLLFSYTVVSNDEDNDGINYQDLDLNGGSIRDQAGNNADYIFVDTNIANVLVDAVAPTATALVINSGESYTTSDAATLNISGNDATEMYITTNASCSAGGTWEAFNTTKAYTLNTNLLNTVYIKLRDAAENEGNCVSASIAHDNMAPNAVSSITLAGDASDIATDNSSWPAAVDNGPAGIDYYEYATSTTTDETGIITGGSWTNIGNVLTYQFDSGVSLIGSTDYYTLIRAVDLAGNVSAIAVSAAYQIIVSPEAITNLEITNATTESLSIGWAYPQDNGTAIVDYQIMIKGGSFSDWTLYNDGVSTATSAIVAGLDPETSYQLKVRAFNGINYSGWSNQISSDTLPNIEFFEPGFKAINIAGAPKNQLVSFADNNEIYLNGTLKTTLNKHDTYQFDATDFDMIEATGAFYVAGKLGTGSGSNDQGNATWATQAWVGKQFFFNFTRATPLKVKVYAFTDSDITITKGGVFQDSKTVTAGSGDTFTLTTYAGYEINSTGYIVAFAYGNASNTYYDPVPILPASTDIIGVPSKSAKISSGTSGNSYTYEHSDGNTNSGTLNAGSVLSVSERNAGLGTGLYKGAALRVRANEPIMAVSNADSDGYCQAPFVPVSMMKKKFGLNVQSNYVAFVSDRPVTITITKPDLTTSTLTLTRTGSGAKTPYKGYLSADYPAGTLFEGDDVFQAWYQPFTGTYSAGEDETIMFGWD
jgi:hypothetical protein